MAKVQMVTPLVGVSINRDGGHVDRAHSGGISREVSKWCEGGVEGMEVVGWVLTAPLYGYLVGFWQTNSVLPVWSSQIHPIYMGKGVRQMPVWSVLGSQLIHNGQQGGDGFLG